MARLASQAIGGFYPCPPEVVALAAAALKPPEGKPFTIMDPCAGEGAAITQLAQLINCPWDNTYAIELNPLRAETVAELPLTHVLAPCSFFGTDIKFSSMSFIWLNPPFDHQIGGGRIELEFAVRAWDLLAKDGVLCLVCPEKTLTDWETKQFLLTHLEEICVARFPPEHRKYNEVMLFGRKRREVQGVDYLGMRMGIQVNDSMRTEPYWLPACSGPPANRFRKTSLTEGELLEALADSPLRRMLEPPPEKSLPQPPMALGAGHTALLLASGNLDGVVRPPHEPPHVIRGSAVKVEELKDESVEESKGSVTTVTTFVERVKFSVRVLGSDGEITTLTQ